MFHFILRVIILLFHIFHILLPKVSCVQLQKLECKSNSNSNSNNQLYTSATNTNNVSAASISWKNETIFLSKEEINKYGFYDHSPFKLNMMENGFILNLKKLNPNGYLKLYEKLKCHEDINIAIFGGSMTIGERCNTLVSKRLSYSSPGCAWQYRFIHYMNIKTIF